MDKQYIGFIPEELRQKMNCLFSANLGEELKESIIEEFGTRIDDITDAHRETLKLELEMQHNPEEWEEYLKKNFDRYMAFFEEVTEAFEDQLGCESFLISIEDQADLCIKIYHYYRTKLNSNQIKRYSRLRGAYWKIKELKKRLKEEVDKGEKCYDYPTKKFVLPDYWQDFPVDE